MDGLGAGLYIQGGGAASGLTQAVITGYVIGATRSVDKYTGTSAELKTQDSNALPPIVASLQGDAELENYADVLSADLLDAELEPATASDAAEDETTSLLELELIPTPTWR
ncbi:hypothetical protein B9479_001355 [Cryptococcus floricola]|uniref:Uncharacterized protein n=1 Tax=Cryptococcus floricola TaxID=2591691 RepID=A0A5D3B6S7_9TREE|nr:hypothetical protein B9479_001355 [Cryptococcus floricola]